MSETTKQKMFVNNIVKRDRVTLLTNQNVGKRRLERKKERKKDINK